MKRTLIGAIVFFISMSCVSILAAAEDPVVLHAEPAAPSPLARIVAIQARVEVTVANDGSVSEAHALQPRPPFVAAISEQAACKWVFAPSTTGTERIYMLTFLFGGTSETDERSYWEVTTVDPLTLRMQYFQSTVQWLPDLERSPQRCPRHGTRMLLGVAPIRYGLARSYSSDSLSERRALSHARRVWKAREDLFPEAHIWAGSGGCTGGPQKTAETYYCESCRQARLEWFRRHPGSERHE